MATDFADTRAETTPIGPLVSDAWREWLYVRLAGRATPVVQFAEGVRSAASLWAGAREWTQALRTSGMRAADVIVCALPSGPAVLQLLIASLWDGYSLVLYPSAFSDLALDDAADAHQARLVVHDRAGLSGHTRWRHRPADGGWPDGAVPFVLRGADASALGSPMLGDHRGASVTHDALLHDLRTHALTGELTDRRVIVAADWDEAPVLTRGGLLPLLVSEELFVVAAGEPALLRERLDREPITHVLTDAVDAMRETARLAHRSLTVIPLPRTQPRR